MNDRAPGPGDEPLECARRTYEAIEWKCLDTGRDLYGQRARGSRRWDYATLWPFAGAWSALVALASLDKEPSRAERLRGHLDALACYREPLDPKGAYRSSVVPPLGEGGTRYYDDNAWIGLVLCRQARLLADPSALQLADPSALEAAGRILSYLRTGWSNDAHLERPGGLAWREGPEEASVSRNTCSNGPSAELAAELHLLGGDGSQLEAALCIYTWARKVLRNGVDLYADRIGPDGTITPAVLSYNQGSMIGAGVRLHEATGEDHFLSEAERTAAASLDRYRDGSALSREPPAFVAIYLRNLLVLDQVRPDPSYREIARSYVQLLWSRRRPDGLVQPSDRGSVLLASAALVELCSLFGGAHAWP